MESNEPGDDINNGIFSIEFIGGTYMKSSLNVANSFAAICGSIIHVPIDWMWRMWQFPQPERDCSSAEELGNPTEAIDLTSALRVLDLRKWPDKV
ncbi:GM24521 [Drosophila sechellia]|uniref:GM24521 n=1 Tax=Drosophila sechellia TaxID=7238 RepID=B4INJ3_DROSE|nr:GM24521 [Drosophila sechellia]